MARTGASSHLAGPQDGTIYLREVGLRIALIRGEKPQSEFSDLIGIHKNTLGNYERGDREMGVFALARLVDLGWNANWLLTGEGPERLESLGSGESAAAAGNSQDLRPEELSIAIELAEEALRGKWLPKREYAEVIAGIYAMLTEGLPYADILDLTRPTKESKAKHGAGDGSRSEGDSPSEGANHHRRAGGNG